MNRSIRQFSFLLLFTGLYLSAAAWTPKKPGWNDKNTTGIGGSANDGTEVKLPVGIPFLTDPSPASGSSTDENGVTTGQPANIVYTFDLPDGVGPQSVHETHSAFQQARSLNAACVLIRMNSFSNALDAAENLNNEMMDYDRPVMVYVNNRAIPASTLISMAAENKTMQQGSRAADFRSSKNVKHTIPQKNTAANSSVQNHAVSKENSWDEYHCMTQWNPNHLLYSQSSNLNDVLTQAGMEKYTVVHYSAGFFSQIIDWCMKPFASLFLIVLLALGMRIQTKSVFPGPATFLLMVSLPLFGVPLFMGGLSNALELCTAFVLCVALITSARSKTSPPIFRIIAGLLFILALTLCQTGSFGGIIDWKLGGVTFLLSAIAFLAGWFVPSLVSKFSASEDSAQSVDLSAA